MAAISFIGTLVARFFQILFAIVVLGLSVTMAKWQRFGSPPATTEYGAFSGGFAFLVGLLGIVAVFLDAIPAIIVAGADALAAILTLAAGIAYVVTTRGVSCDSLDDTSTNSLINGGSVNVKDSRPIAGYDTQDQLTGRCKKVEADYVFMFLTFALSAILVGLGLLTNGRRSGSKAMV
ncbi:hypothetical protein EV356DRAFT_535986 [Viridothelium virens]|uniref:MARVEL domain-containing protein n=1 Tax=Viridothelium virens TaxID=1048519 RepID=A0A6A6GYU5_VIRVR|nr:hypothetical protein EV356DRAFT_535986 [Viridothelium virens]